VRHGDEVTRPVRLDGVSPLKFVNHRRDVVIAGTHE
jgi:hypothetical protein